MISRRRVIVSKRLKIRAFGVDEVRSAKEFATFFSLAQQIFAIAHNFCSRLAEFYHWPKTDLDLSPDIRATCAKVERIA